METKFKVGDKVLLNKPKDTKTDGLIWFPKMDKFDGKCFYVEQINKITGRYYCRYNKIYLWLHESWLTKAEEQPTEQVTEQVATPIDWEQRRWDLYKMFLMHYSQHSIGEALNAADRCIEFYKQKKQN